MSQMQIEETTDGLYVGQVFTTDDLPNIRLDDDVVIVVERTMDLPDGGTRFINSNYTIDAKEI